MAETFGERAWKTITDLTASRRGQGLSLHPNEVGPLAISALERLYHTPPDIPQCPVCSSPPRLSLYPTFNYAHNTSAKRGESCWILIGCSHSSAINFEKILNAELRDEYEANWRKEVIQLFDKHTATWTPEERRVRWQKLNYVGEPPAKQQQDAA